MIRGVLLSCGTVLALCACAGTRPDPPPQSRVEAPANWRTGLQTSGAASRDAWWTDFGDPVLDAIVETALANNVDLAIAAARVQEARAQYRFAGGQAGPDVALALVGGRQRSVNAFGRGLTQTYGQGQVSVSYEVDLFGRLAASTAAAREAMLASEDARDTLALSVAATAVNGYVTLRALDARLGLLRDTLQARAESLHVIRRRADTGYGSKLELHQAEADYQSTAQLIPATQLAITRQEDGLSVLLGDAPRDIHRGEALIAMRLAPVPDAGLPSALLRARPDIAQAEHQLVAADRSLDAARANFLPRIQLSAFAGHAESNVLRSGVDVFSIGGSILAPLFQRGKLRAQADAAASRRDQAAFAYRRTVLVAFREVEDALASVQRNAEQEAAIAAQRDAAAAALALAIRRYRAGYSPYLEQQDAQRVLLAGEIALIQARADRLSAIVALHQSLGGDWAE
jgi:NodT family efflux transporter outer membrane factor (OMF) lipoprotein